MSVALATIDREHDLFKLVPKQSSRGADEAISRHNQLKI